MLNKNIFLHLYKAAYMQRWNDHLRPIDLYELDKQAHKMIIAYILGIKKDKEKYKQLNVFFINNISKDLENIEDGLFLEKFKNYIFADNVGDDNINKKILNAAHSNNLLQ